LPDGGDLCGDKGTGNCWCDDLCADFGDCCSDAADVCGLDAPEPEGDACGGIAGLQCDEGEFCMWSPEQFCGAADHLGVCTPQPEACIALFAPVCGCDGQTYSNSCMAAAAGMSVVHDGACDAEPGQFCGGIAGIACPEGQVCVNDPTDTCDPALGGADCGGVCVPDTDACPDAATLWQQGCPLFCENGFATGDDGCLTCSCAEPEPEPCHVGGCSSELCVGPDDPDISICIFQPWTECLSLTECGNFGTSGSCGWEPNPAYIDCLASHGL
jgi:hypothetical protein